MERTKLETYLSKFRGSKASYPFGPEALVYKVIDKMFALVSQEEIPARVTLKCDPADGELLVAQFEAVSPGYYMNKRHWITICLTGEVADELLRGLADDSYTLFVNKLSKMDKRKLGSVNVSL